MTKTRLAWRGLLLAFVLVGVLTACNLQRPTATPTTTPTATPGPTATATPTSTPVPTSVPLTTLPSVADIVEKVRPAVVSIVSETRGRDIFGRPFSEFGSGSGVIFDPRGYVLTNNHVVEGAVRITVNLFDGRQFEAQLVGADVLTDLAVVRVPADKLPQPAALGDSTKLRIGDWVIAIGNALNLPGGPTVTLGVVSAVNRSLDEGGGVVLHDLVQTDAAINPGNSGGPLLNLKGEVVGINTAVLRGDGLTGAGNAEGIGFAVAADVAADVSQQLMANGRVIWPWLGVSVEDLTPVTAAEQNLKVTRGVLVAAVQPNGPAAKAGMRADDVIIKLGGNEVPDIRSLQRLLRRQYKVGQEVAVSLIRSGSEAEVKVTLEEFPRS